MLIVVEGPSAVGKTTFLKTMPSGQVVGEEMVRTPVGLKPGEEIHHYLKTNILRWKGLLEAEKRYGVAFADGDPLKLYYDFALVLNGYLDRGVYEAECTLIERAMTKEEIGFADRVVYLSASPEKLAERMARDSTRRRSKFALHQRLVPAMKAYYSQLEKVRPGSLRWVNAEEESPLEAGIGSQGPHPGPLSRCDVRDLSLLKERLDLLLARELR